MPRDARAYLSDITDSCDAIVWAIVEHDVPVLRRECASLILRVTPDNEAGQPSVARAQRGTTLRSAVRRPGNWVVIV